MPGEATFTASNQIPTASGQLESNFSLRVDYFVGDILQSMSSLHLCSSQTMYDKFLPMFHLEREFKKSHDIMELSKLTIKREFSFRRFLTSSLTDIPVSISVGSLLFIRKPFVHAEAVAVSLCGTKSYFD